MKRLGLLLLPCLLACDLKENEIGESGNVSAGEGGDSEEGSGSESGSGSDDVLGCTLIGCEDGLFVIITHGGLADGNYQVRLLDADTGDQQFSCDFGVSGGNVGDSDCLLGAGNNTEVHVILPLGVAHAQIEVLLDGAQVGSIVAEPEYEDVYPNGPDCGVGCTQGYVTLALGPSGSTCESLETDFNAQVEAVRGCTDAAECGQVIEGTSCGCTRNWVARTDADLTQFWAIFDEAAGLDCDWAGFGSTCDCPEADGYACIDNVCEWNYL
jgi:hypothetical protein